MDGARLFPDFNQRVSRLRKTGCAEGQRGFLPNLSISFRKKFGHKRNGRVSLDVQQRFQCLPGDRGRSVSHSGLDPEEKRRFNALQLAQRAGGICPDACLFVGECAHFVPELVLSSEIRTLQKRQRANAP